MTLVIQDLTCRPAGQPPIEAVTFQVQPREIVAVVGPNGAGKSTLVRCTAMLFPPERGTVWLGGTRIPRDPSAVARAGLGVVLKGHRVFSSLSVRENLLTALLVKSQSGDDHLQTVYELFPVLRERMNQPAGLLSGGEQQMLAIARSLVAAPRVLVLDEPSLGLSPMLADRVYDALRSVAAFGAAVLVTDESADRARRHSDRLLWMERGRIVDGSAPLVPVRTARSAGQPE